MRLLPTACLLLLAAGTAQAQQDGVVTYTSNGSYDDTTFGLESAIVNQGLTINTVNDAGEALERTGKDLGDDTVILDNGAMYQFCSVVLSRKMLKLDPLNIAYCPYQVFVIEREGEVTVGYRAFPEGPLQEVQELVDEIAREAAGQ